MASLTISIVTYGIDADTLQETLETLGATLEKAIQDQRISSSTLVILDNGNDLPLIQTIVEKVKFPKTTVVYVNNPDNLGYGKAHNIAIFRDQHDYHLILNPDVELPLNAISICIQELETSSDRVLIAASGISESGRPLYLTKTYPSVMVLALRALNIQLLNRWFSERLSRYEVAEPHEHPDPMLLASGCFLFCRKSALQAAGGFDERYFLYFEDFDLSLRIREYGQCYFPKKLSIVHKGGNAARKNLAHIRHFTMSAFRFFQTHGWKWL